MTVPEKYRARTQQQLLDKAYDLGVDFERYSGSCSQCTVAALHEILGFEDILVKVASSSCGGQAGLSIGACGGVIGGTLVLDYYLGRPARMVSATKAIPEGQEALSGAMAAARSLCDRFVRHYGSILCPGIQQKIYGRAFDLQNPADWQAFMDAGAHSDPTKCMSVVGNAARWTLEILLEKKAIIL
ncbi:MAG: C-GCAxxG-C-C family protein [Acidobacteriota bacterium]|nr:C-GCAxxG-C-C family protein [Acidobacteriota bacterium]